MKYVVEPAHAACVPMAVHLDHCVEPDDVEAALELPFDSIMTDVSAKDTDRNNRECKRIVQIANQRGICVEAELGRIEGGEDGLPTVHLGAVMTQPTIAREFVEETGVHFLTPSFGNIHGNYGPDGPRSAWDLSL